MLRLIGALLGACLLVLAGGSPSYAHSTDPRIVSVLDGVSPSLPAGVLVQVRANLAAQLLVDNPTAEPLEVLAPTGEVFLRLSRAGVFANLGSPEFFATSNPNAGGSHRRRSADRFVEISAGTSWGWYDHRLHPGEVSAPEDTRTTTRLGRFEVPMRYGGAPLTVRGHLEFRPLLGAFEDRVRSAPPGLTASVLQGRLPGLFVTASAPLTVLGRDGEPFLRSDGTALSVNTASRTYVEDQQARGVEVGPSSPMPRWKPVGSSSYTWLDARLRYASAAPPEAALRRTSPSVIGAWSIPLAGGSAISGDIRWVPAPGARAAGGEPGRDGRGRTPVAVLAGAAGVGLVGLLLVLGAAVRRRRATPRPRP